MKALILIFGCFLLLQTAFAEEGKKGWLREKLKDRWIKKQQQKPAPEARTDFGKIDAAGTHTFTFSHNGSND